MSLDKNKRQRGRAVPPPRPSEQPENWWALANQDMMNHVVEGLRPRFTDIAWQGFRELGPGFIWLTIPPDAFSEWREAWQKNGPYSGDHDIGTDYLPIQRLIDNPNLIKGYEVIAPCAQLATRYNPTTHMVIGGMLPAEDLSGYQCIWAAFEQLEGVNNNVVERCKELDRALLNNIPGAVEYIRCAVKGEYRCDGPMTPFNLTTVKRVASDQRMRGPHQSMVCIGGDAIGDVMIDGPIEGFIYLVRRRDEVKIGKTINLRQRLKQLESVFAIEGLDHYILTDDVSKAERAIHKWLAPYRMSGEWFRLPPDKAELLKHVLCLYMHEHPDHVNSNSEQGWARVSIETAARISEVAQSGK